MLLGTRNSAKDENGEFSPVADFAELDCFSCGDEDLDEYFHQDAIIQQEKLLSTTYTYRFYVDGGLSAPVAVASLLNDSIKLKPEIKAECDLLDTSYHQFPAVKIGRLGTHRALARSGIGTAVLNIIKDLFITSNRTGCRFITIDARNDPYVLKFYEKNGFMYYSKKDTNKYSRQMYYDLKPFKAGLSMHTGTAG